MIKLVRWDLWDVTSMNKAARLKSRLESQGARLISQGVNFAKYELIK